MSAADARRRPSRYDFSHLRGAVLDRPREDIPNRPDPRIQSLWAAAFRRAGVKMQAPSTANALWDRAIERAVGGRR